MSEDDHLALIRLNGKSPCHSFAPAVVERGHWVIEDNAPFGATEAHLRKEGADGDGALLTFAQYLCRVADLR